MTKHILIKPYNLLHIRLVPCGDIKGINRTSPSIYVHSSIPRLSPGSPTIFLSLLLDCSPPCCFRSSSLSPAAFRAMLQSLLCSVLMILPMNFIIGSVVSCLITVVFLVLLFYPAIRTYEF